MTASVYNVYSLCPIRLIRMGHRRSAFHLGLDSSM